MCGIAGIFHRDGRPVEAARLARMTRTLIHRGPDEEGYFVNTPGPPPGLDGTIPLRTLRADSQPDTVLGHVGLGHRRLSIIDLVSGQQPLSNEDGTIWITYNGEVYNFQELTATLLARGHRFRTHCDTETIVHAYEEWGEACVERFRGMFVFAIWDQRKQRLMLARDRVGKKPLYYHADAGRVVFGSEIKAILAAGGVSRDLDLPALSDYLSLLYVPSPRTIFAAIRKLPAAHIATIDSSGIQIRPYWDLPFAPRHDLTDEQMMETIVELLQEATRLRMISDVPLGAFLSGGVDSSAVVGLMAGASTQPVITNSISFSESSYDESAHARRVAKLFATDHNEYHVTAEAIPVVEKLAFNYDEPFADSSAVPTYYVSKTARERVTVALSGDGGDENFAGYRRYYFDLRENAVRELLPWGMGRSIFTLLGRLYPKLDYAPRVFRGKAFISNVARHPVDAYLFSMSAFKEEQKARLLAPDVQGQLSDYRTSELFHDIYRGAPAEDHLSKIQYLDVKTYLCEDILTKVDRASMAVSLEVRCPILDHSFMEFVARIPPDLKLVGRSGKHVFKRALTRLLPEDILHRRKMGFGVPILEWLRTDLAGYAEDLVLRGAATRDVLDGAYATELWSEHRRGRRNWSAELWAVMMLNLWYRNYAHAGAD